jgi:hypothetical protein
MTKKAERPEQPEQQAAKIECAVRFDCHFGKHDDIIELPRGEAKAAEADGFVDTHPNAIKAIREG